MHIINSLVRELVRGRSCLRGVRSVAYVHRVRQRGPQGRCYTGGRQVAATVALEPFIGHSHLRRLPHSQDIIHSCAYAGWRLLVPYFPCKPFQQLQTQTSAHE
eukprot:6178217-Pleurochrysis_carterae.AAC.1